MGHTEKLGGLGCNVGRVSILGHADDKGIGWVAIGMATISGQVEDQSGLGCHRNGNNLR